MYLGGFELKREKKNNNEYSFISIRLIYVKISMKYYNKIENLFAQNIFLSQSDDSLTKKPKHS